MAAGLKSNSGTSRGGSDKYRDQLLAAGWTESTEPFWRDENPCFYDLTLTKTVLLFADDSGDINEQHYFWKFDAQPRPEFIPSDQVQVRRYKLHHSMNALLWHDYGDRKIVH